MAKKKKKKLKKKLKAQALEQAMKKNDSQNQTKTKAKTKSEAKEKIKNVDNEEIASEKKQAKIEARKILITMGIIAIVIVGIYILNIKTDLVLRSGEYLTNLLNIKI